MRCHVPPPHVVLVQSSVPAAARFKFLCSGSLLLLLMIMAESKRRKRSLIRVPSIETKALENTAAKAMQSRVMASWYHDGTLLDQLAHHHMTHFAEVVTSRPSHDIMPARMTWGSLSSGWGDAHFAVNACRRILRAPPSNESKTASGQDKFMLQVFACEPDPQKQRWIDHMSNSRRRSAGLQLMCIFCNNTDMRKDRAMCFTHSKECIVPNCNLLVVSTSCAKKTPLGPRSNHYKEALLPYLDNHSVDLIVLEDNDHITDDPQGADILRSELSSRSFESQCFILNSKLFGAPQDTRRFWAVFFASTQTILDYSSRSMGAMFTTLKALLQICQTQHPPLLDVLLPDDNTDLASIFGGTVKQFARPPGRQTNVFNVLQCQRPRKKCLAG